MLKIDNLALGDQIVCDGYGIGEVVELYDGNFRGEMVPYIKLNFKHLNMNYQLPLHNLQFRNISPHTKIKKLFKEDIKQEVKTLLDLNFNVQQTKMSEKLGNSTIEDIVFLLRFLDTKKRHSATHSLCSYDENLYRKVSQNLAEELSVTMDKTIPECNVELKKLLDKHKIELS